MGHPHKSLRKLQGNLTAWMLLLAQGVISRLPLRGLEMGTAGLNRLTRLALIHYQKIARINLTLIYGDSKTPAEKEEILTSLFRHLERMATEYFLLIRNQNIPSLLRIELEGEEYLREALRRKKGVILLSGHLGNFPLLLLYLAERGYPVTVVARDPRNPTLARYVQRVRGGMKVKSIPVKPRTVSVKKSLECLRRNEILFLQLDQRPHRRLGIEIKFFGRPALSFAGPAVLARRTGAAVLPAFITRGEGYHHRIVIEESLDLPRDDIPASLQIMNRVIEDHILACPEQWWWFHRRFPKAIYSLPPEEAFLPGYPARA